MRVTLLLAAFLTGCAPDPGPGDFDGDGLMDLVDPYPRQIDGDGDGLDDPDELELGTDPTVADTDGDTYLDGDEVFEGTDPLDQDSRIYTARWPYWRNKDDLRSPEWSRPEVGRPFPRHRASDFRGDLVDLYDFGGPDAPYDYIVVDSCAEWCPPCNALASWISGGPDSAGFDAKYQVVREAVADGRVLWMELMVQDSSGQPPDADDLLRWHQSYRWHSPVLGDTEEQEADRYLNRGTYPQGALIAPKTMTTLAAGDFYDTLDVLVAELDAQATE